VNASATAGEAGARRRVRCAVALTLAMICVPPAGVAWAQSPPPSGLEHALADVRADISRGSYASAEERGRALYERVSKESGVESLSAARALEVLVEALIVNGTAGTGDALERAQRVLAVMESQPRADNAEISGALCTLGDVHVQRGTFHGAIPIYERALEIRSRTSAENDPGAPRILEHLSIAFTQLGRLPDARRVLAQSLRMREAGAGADPLSVVQSLEPWALLHKVAGNVSDGLTAADRALAIRRRLTPAHPRTAELLHLRGDLQWMQGDRSGANATYGEALALAEDVLRPGHPLIALLLRKRGLAASVFGDLTEARRLRERALALSVGAYAPCHPETAGFLSDLAVSLRAEGNYIEAERLYRRALTANDTCLGPSHRLTALVAFNLGNLMSERGELVEAQRLYERARRAWASGVEPSRTDEARAIGALAEVAEKRGQLVRARTLYERALGLRRRALGPAHVDVASTLINLARVADGSGQTRLAIDSLDQAEAIINKPGSSNQPERLSLLMTVRGDIEQRRGELSAARASYSAAVAQREGMYGPTHPNVAAARAQLARVEFAQGDTATALVNALTAEDIGRQHLRNTVRYLPERQALAYAARRPHALDLAISLAHGSDQMAPIYDAVIQSRGVVLDALVSRSPAVHSNVPGATSLHASATRARERYANLVIRSLQDPVSPAVLETARREKEEAERALVESSVDALMPTGVGFRDVRDALAAGSALVSFVKYELTRAPAPGARGIALPVPSYAAFVYRPEGSRLSFVPLGTAARLGALISGWRAEVANPSGPAGGSATNAAASYRLAAARLRRAVWDPLAPHLAGAARTFVVPDGQINVVNIAALPDTAGRYLIESGSTIHYLATERDLVAGAQTPSRGGLLAVGGPAFGSAAATGTSGAPTRFRSQCEGFGDVRFQDLPGSRREARAIGAAWPAHRGDEVTVLSGAAATESAVKKALGGRRVVHLATHGFFLGGDCSDRPAGTRAVGGLTTVSSKKPESLENPLLLSGLAFAGANLRRSVMAGEDDGILTAEEISGLDLQGVQWAVLSACDTGLGEIKAGEGVFGLRRAFQIAGARTVIMSLWSVEDRSAMDWMRALYAARLQRNLDTVDAVREAGLVVLRQRRARGQSTHPFFWAGFVASGDWR
jgi:CHAT domain-containing protein/tetratricopeptide (TPR) repeat protein